MQQPFIFICNFCFLLQECGNAKDKAAYVRFFSFPAFVIPYMIIIGGIPVEREMIIVLDFGGQYNQLIARRVRECNVYCEVHPYTLGLEKIREMNPKGIIFTGGPNSVYKEESPHCEKEIFEMGIPILGICYGSQLMAHMLGGSVATAPVSEYGKTEVDTEADSRILDSGCQKSV